MANDHLFSLNNLSKDPSFNFLHTFSYLTYAEEDESSFDFSDSPYYNRNISCSYIDELTFVNTFNNLPNFSYMSLNIQSLSSKFAEFNELICHLNLNKCSPDIIALQEIWQVPDPSFFPLINYNLIEFKCRHNNVQGGGVGLYFKKGVRFNILQEKCRVGHPFFSKESSVLRVLLRSL